MSNRFAKNNIARANITIASTAISTATTTAQATSTDTFGADWVSFEVDITTYANGTLRVAINESDLANQTLETAVPAAQIKYYKYSAAGAPIASGDSLTATGKLIVCVLNTKRYVTCDIVTSGTVSLTASAQVRVFSTNNPQIA
jgi:hypothetical protein